jgi:hypothetical protein
MGNRIGGARARAAAIAISVCVVVLASSAVADAAVRHTVTTVNGVNVDRYVWTDSTGHPRTVSLKQEGNGNPGHGGYAVQMTYQALINGTWRTVTANADPNEGWGYFVSHESYRTYSDGDSRPIADKIFDKNDSPLSHNFPVTSTALPSTDPSRDAHRFTLNYPRYGTLSAHDPFDVLSLDPAGYKKYNLPVTETWYFEDGADYPRISTSVSLAGVGAPDRVNFDVRGPYGVLDFDHGNNVIRKVMWGDRFHFTTQGAPVTRNSEWTWTRPNRGARYTALIAGAYEMGLVEPLPYNSSATVDGFSSSRGLSSAGDYMGCADSGWILPCDWEWPYQSAQYGLPYGDHDAPTIDEKIAWGSVPLYGAGPNTTESFDSPTHSNPFVGYPASGRISYDICVVLGRTITGGLTKTVAATSPYDCAARS